LSEAQFYFGRLAESAATYEELMESMDRFGRDTDRRWGRASLAAIRATQGRWDEALELAEGFIAEVEAGSPHYLEPTAFGTRASIRLTRGDLTGASADTERALEVARLAKDAQLVAPALQHRANVLLARGMRAEATALTDEMLSLGAKLVPGLISGFLWAILEVAWLARVLAREAPLLALLRTAPEFPWVIAARAGAAGDWEAAATVLAKIECRPAEAYARLNAAEELVGAGRADEAEPHLEAALAFYRSVGAAHFIRKAEALAVGVDKRASSERHASSG
jgi:tetratricopeptide (TPR) repeat protein